MRRAIRRVVTSRPAIGLAYGAVAAPHLNPTPGRSGLFRLIAPHRMLSVTRHTERKEADDAPDAAAARVRCAGRPRYPQRHDHPRAHAPLERAAGRAGSASA